MSTTGRILDIIDAGLQHSDEASYGTDMHPERCARCQRHEPTGGDLCCGCVAFLVGDANEDPLSSRMAAADLVAHTRALAEAFLPALERAAEAFRSVAADWAERTGKTTEDFLELIEAIQADEPEPPHRRQERQLLDQLRRSQRRTNRWGPRPGR